MNYNYCAEVVSSVNPNHMYMLCYNYYNGQYNLLFGILGDHVHSFQPSNSLIQEFRKGLNSWGATEAYQGGFVWQNVVPFKKF